MVRLSAGRYGTAEKIVEDILKSALKIISPRERSKDSADSVGDSIVHIHKYIREGTRTAEMESNT